MQLLDLLPERMSAPVDVSHPLFPHGSLYTRQSLKAGTTVFRTGDSAPGILYVISGLLKAFRVSGNGREIAVSHVAPGEVCFISISCVFTDTPYPTEAVAIEDSEVLLLPRAEFLHLYNTSEGARQYVAEAMSAKTSALINRIEEIAFLTIQERLERFLLRYAKRKNIISCVEMTHDEIARSLGTSREVISRLLLAMERQGDVKLDRRRVTLLPHLTNRA